MTFATGINIYLKMVGNKKRIPFELALDKQRAFNSIDEKITRDEKEKAFVALNGVLAGHEIDLDKEREERILSST